MELLAFGLNLSIYTMLIGKFLILIILFIWASIRVGFFKTLGISILFNVCFFVLAFIFTEKDGEFLLFSIFGTLVYCILLIILIVKTPVKHIEARDIRENNEDKKNIPTDSEIKKD